MFKTSFYYFDKGQRNRPYSRWKLARMYVFFHLHGVTTSHPLATFFGGRLCYVLFVLQYKDLRRVVSRRIPEQIMCISLHSVHLLFVFQTFDGEASICVKL